MRELPGDLVKNTHAKTLICSTPSPQDSWDQGILFPTKQGLQIVLRSKKPNHTEFDFTVLEDPGCPWLIEFSAVSGYSTTCLDGLRFREGGEAAPRVSSPRGTGTGWRRIKIQTQSVTPLQSFPTLLEQGGTQNMYMLPILPSTDFRGADELINSSFKSLPA